jgi:3-hydroxyisobutyrate dehydrogenase-like beta-hydroxyacid dehydrogenase
MKIGFAGLGMMGVPMAKNLIKGGHTLFVYNRTPGKDSELRGLGATVCKSAADAARSADVTVTMLSDSNAVRDVVLGPSGAIEGLSAGKVLIDMSTIDPTTSSQVALELSKKGIDMLDAPVLGSTPLAVKGELVILVGGKKEVFEQMRGVLALIGSKIIHVGPQSSGEKMKLISNQVMLTNFAAIAEATMLAAKAGISRETAYEAIGSGGANSRVLELKRQRLLASDFSAQFKLVHANKDINLAIEMAKGLNASEPVAAVVAQEYISAMAEGLKDDDYTVMLRSLLAMNGLK